MSGVVELPLAACGKQGNREGEDGGAPGQKIGSQDQIPPVLVRAAAAQVRPQQRSPSSVMAPRRLLPPGDATAIAVLTCPAGRALPSGHVAEV